MAGLVVHSLNGYISERNCRAINDRDFHVLAEFAGKSFAVLNSVVRCNR